MPARRPMRSATATSGLPSVLKSPMAVDQLNGLAAFPNLNATRPDGAGSVRTASGKEEAGERSMSGPVSAWDVADASSTNAAHTYRERRRRRVASPSVFRTTVFISGDATRASRNGFSTRAPQCRCHRFCVESWDNRSSDAKNVAAGKTNVSLSDDSQRSEP